MKPSEVLIEQYVVNRGGLTEKEVDWIETWIRDDQEVRRLVEWFDYFYEVADKIESFHERMVDVPSTIILKTAGAKPNYGNGPMVLAAYSHEANHKKTSLQTLQTFISNEDSTLIRVLYDPLKEEYQVKVISEHVQMDDIVLLEGVSTVPSFYVSAPGGTITIPVETEGQDRIEWKDTCKLNLPVSRVFFYKETGQGTVNFDMTMAHFQNDDLQIEKTDHELKLYFDPSQLHVQDKAVLYNRKETFLVPITDSGCTISLEKVRRPETTLFFY